jgi:hypothetical protein
MNTSEETIAIRNLVGARGGAFAIAFFKAANVTEETLARLYYGQEVPAEELERIRKVMKERLKEDVSAAPNVSGTCPQCGKLL